MNILNAIRSLFHRDQPITPTLRCKPGGMAWIKPYGQEYGAGVLAGLAVKTVRVVDGTFWEIDPKPQYVVRGLFGIRGFSGDAAYPGDRVCVTAIADACLEPWKDDGITREEVDDLYAPDELAFVDLPKERV